MEKTIVVKTKGICKEFDGKSVLNHLHMQVEEGQLYGILGINGAGKTTLLKLLAGLLEPTEGSAYVLGEHMWENRNGVLGRIGCLIEVPVFYEHLSAAENLRIHLAYMNAQADITETLHKVGLGETGKKPVGKFSLGMRQRLAIARCMIHKPKVMLLDEPINGLDPVAMREMRQLFIDLCQSKTTILLSSHILSEVVQTASKVAILSGGELVMEEDMKVLKETHQENLETYLIRKMEGESR